MAIKNSFFPNYAIHPGEYLEELLECTRMEKAELATRLGITPKHLSNIVNGKAAITARTAVALEYVFADRPAHYWLGLQEAYDVHEARSAVMRSIEERAESKNYLETFDVETLAVAGYIEQLDSQAPPGERVSALLKFFGCSNATAWQQLYGDLLRRLPAGHWDERGSLMLAWMRKGQLEASRRGQAFPRFERRAFGRALGKAKALTLRSDGEVMGELQCQCERAGVMLCFEDPLPRMQSASAAYWLKNTPCIQVSKSVQTCDEWWLNFAREAAYVMEGKTYEISLNGKGGETESIVASATWLVSWEECLSFASREDFSVKSVTVFAEKVGVHPGIIVGALQRACLVQSDSPLNALKTRFEYAVVDF